MLFAWGSLYLTATCMQIQHASSWQACGRKRLPQLSSTQHIPEFGSKRLEIFSTVYLSIIIFKFRAWKVMSNFVHGKSISATAFPLQGRFRQASLNLCSTAAIARTDNSLFPLSYLACGRLFAESTVVSQHVPAQACENMYAGRVRRGQELFDHAFDHRQLFG